MSEWKEQVEETCTRILEDWAMMMVEPSSAEEFSEADAPAHMVSVIRFTGKVNGEYRIWCGDEFAATLATNLLGLMEDASNEEKLDSLREMANVLCGNILTELYGTDSVFDLKIPEIVTPVDDTPEGWQQEETIWLLGDDAPLAMTFVVDK